jgi:hypothetical protein
LDKTSPAQLQLPNHASLYSRLLKLCGFLLMAPFLVIVPTCLGLPQLLSHRSYALDDGSPPYSFRSYIPLFETMLFSQGSVQRISLPAVVFLLLFLLHFSASNVAGKLSNQAQTKFPWSHEKHVHASTRTILDDSCTTQTIDLFILRADQRLALILCCFY